MNRFLPPMCQAHALEVRVSYDGFRDDVHHFSVSSLSTNNTWDVQVKLSHRLDMTGNLSPEQLCQGGLVRIFSNDPFFWYGGAAYNATVNNYGLVPCFIAPRYANHDYGMSHTAYAVLQLISRLGGGVLETSFSKVLRWNGFEYVS